MVPSSPRLATRRATPALVALPVAALLLAAAACTSRPSSRIVRLPGAAGNDPTLGDTLARNYGTAPADGLLRLRLRARNGHVTVATGREDSVRVRVAIGPPVDGSSAGRCRREQALLTGLMVHRVGDAAVPELDVRRDPGCVDYWTIEVPPRFALDVTAINASVRVTGAAGGVRAATTVGRIDVRVPAGSVDALVRETGDVFVRTASSAFEEAAVETRVGTAGIAIDGATVPTPASTGPGQRVTARGTSGDRFQLRTEIGHARLEVDRRAAVRP